MRVLITGGAGYIGSHVVAALGEKGFEIVVYDNLSTGHRDALLYGRLVVGDLGNREQIAETIAGFKPDAIMHFAASIQVGESVREPLLYYRNNSVNTVNLLDAAKKAGVRNFIFSSTAAVYGTPETIPISEENPVRPINPYGHSKAFIETMLRDLATTGELNYAALRYFNAAGADPLCRIGERHNPETHLIPLVLKTAKGDRESISVNGTDYPTPDGTCVRDYIHVMDLAEAHILALQYLMDGGAGGVFNCGYGHGYSVRAVINAAKTVTGKEFRVIEGERRQGDPAVLVAQCSKIKTVLHWEPRLDDLKTIIKSAWEWEKKQRS